MDFSNIDIIHRKALNSIIGYLFKEFIFVAAGIRKKKKGRIAS